MDGLRFVKSNSSRKGPRRLGSVCVGRVGFPGRRGIARDWTFLNTPQSDQPGENCMLGLEEHAEELQATTRVSLWPSIVVIRGHW